MVFALLLLLLLLLTSVVIDLVLPGRGLTSTPKTSRLASAPRCHRSSLAGKVAGSAFAPTDRRQRRHAPPSSSMPRGGNGHNGGIHCTIKKSRLGFFIAKSKSPTTTTTTATTIIAAAAAAAATRLERGPCRPEELGCTEELFFFHSYLFPSYYPSITINIVVLSSSSSSSINCTIIFYK
ncbi:hypothetical protein T05_13057 [Trichinella murrelli]|uniref:Secreted protein n=1 Tax=Trichinella murrelli TaxID=144512 RepID=A0A0V0UD45_9BILA|nr:hypothetical protein T05_13057 [Trichinella murrelli]